MDTIHQILSIRGCVAIPALWCYLFLMDISFHTLVTVHLSTPTDWTDRGIQSPKMPSGCPWHPKVTPTRKAIDTHLDILSHTNILSSWIVVPTQAIGKHSPLKFLLPMMSTTVCLPAGCHTVSHSSVLQLLICKEILLLGSLLQNGWRHDPGDFVLFITIVVPTGFTVQCTIHICVPFLDHLVDYRDCRWYLKDVNVSWQVCCFVFLKNACHWFYFSHRVTRLNCTFNLRLCVQS